MSIDKDISLIKSFLIKNVKVTSSLKFDNHKLRTQRCLQHIFSKRFVGSKQKIFELVIDHAERAERSCPKAGVMLLKKFAGINIENYANPMDKKAVIDQLENLRLSKFSESILIEILNLCNSETKLKIIKSINEKSYVEVSNDYQFDVTSLLPVKRNLDKNCKIFVIDGYLESVSEIHHILQYFSKIKTLLPGY